MSKDEAHRPRKALIIGAGIAGPTTAIFLKQGGIDAEVFEAWPYSTDIGGVCRSRQTGCMCSPRSGSPTN